MAREIWTNLKELNDLQKLLKRGPRAVKYVNTNFVNNLAFQAKKLMPGFIDRDMKVRNRRFVNRQIRVQKARASETTPTSFMGSVYGNNFTGWRENFLGVQTKKQYAATPLGRTGKSEEGQVRRGFRLSNKNDSLRQGDFGLGLSDHETVVFLQILDRENEQRPFYIQKKYKKLSRGMYVMRSHKIKRVYDLEKKRRQPVRRSRALQDSADTVLSRRAARATWVKELKRQLRRG
jgi:hypothetical protein